MDDEALANWLLAAKSGGEPHGAEGYVLELKLTRAQRAAMERALPPDSKANVLRVPVSAPKDLVAVLAPGPIARSGRLRP